MLKNLIIFNKIESYGDYFKDVFSSYLERREHSNPKYYYFSIWG